MKHIEGNSYLPHDNFDTSKPDIGDQVMIIVGEEERVAFGKVESKKQVKFGGEFIFIRTDEGSLEKRAPFHTNVLVTKEELHEK